jgi:hypothetical protein
LVKRTSPPARYGSGKTTQNCTRKHIQTIKMKTKKKRRRIPLPKKKRKKRKPPPAMIILTKSIALKMLIKMKIRKSQKLKERRV